MEDDLNFFQKWKTTSIFSKMEDDLHFFKNERRPHFFPQKWKTTPILSKMEDDLYFFCKWKTTSIIFKLKTTTTFDQMQDNLNILANGRRPIKIT
jgi:hypothetical protein